MAFTFIQVVLSNTTDVKVANIILFNQHFVCTSNVFDDGIKPLFLANTCNASSLLNSTAELIMRINLWTLVILFLQCPPIARSCQSKFQLARKNGSMGTNLCLIEF